MVMPITSPTVPTPSKTSEEANPEACAERKEWPAEPDTWIRIPSRPGIQRRPVNRPRIVRRNINDIGVARFNFDVGAAIGNHILRRSLETAGLLGAVTHRLYRVHDVLRLVVVRIAERRGPGKIFVHVAEDVGECRQSLDAGIPRHLVHGLRQGFAVKVVMVMNPAVSLHDLLRECGRRQDLRYQLVRIKCDGCYQIL